MQKILTSNPLHFTTAFTCLTTNHISEIILCKASKDSYNKTKIVIVKNSVTSLDNYTIFINDRIITEFELNLIDNAISVISNKFGIFILLDDGNILAILDKFPSVDYEFDRVNTYISFYENVKDSLHITALVTCDSFIGVLCGSTLHTYNKTFYSMHPNIVWYISDFNHTIMYDGDRVQAIGEFVNKTSINENFNNWFDSLLHTSQVNDSLENAYSQEFNKFEIKDTVDASDTVDDSTIINVSKTIDAILNSIYFRITHSNIFIIINGKVKIFGDIPDSLITYFENMNSVVDIQKITYMDQYVVLFENGNVMYLIVNNYYELNYTIVNYLNIVESTCTPIPFNSIDSTNSTPLVINNPIKEIVRLLSYILLVDSFGNKYIVPKLPKPSEECYLFNKIASSGCSLNRFIDFETIEDGEMELPTYLSVVYICINRDKQLKILDSDFIDITQQMTNISDTLYIHSNESGNYI